MIYLDSCMLIYAVEDDGNRGSLVRQQLAEAGSQVVAISPLVMLECLVGPLRAENLVLHDLYRRAFEKFRVLDSAIPEHFRAAELRARHGLRTPDALHLAIAQLNGCTELWTNDDRLASAAHGLVVRTIR